MMITRASWMEIDLDKIAYNVDEIRKIIQKESDIMAIVKADAYQHGAEEVSRLLITKGIKYFGVAHLSEALHLRKYFSDIEILILGYTPKYLFQKAIENSISLNIYNLEQAKELSKTAVKINKNVKIHIKIETGMNRLGFSSNPESEANKSVEIISEIYKMPKIIIEGIFSHFAVADDDFDYTKKQVENFNFMISELEKLNIKPKIKHISNSAAVMNFSEYNYGMIRAGILLYGVYPFTNADRELLKLKNAMSLKSTISNIKTIKKGEKVSYGLTFEAKKETKIATIPLGYADGYSRELSNVGKVIVNDKFAPIVGRVCMDQFIIDITGIDAKIEDEVILLGNSETKKISIEELSSSCGQIPASFLCMLNKRIPRVYIEEGKIKRVLDYILEL